MDLRLYLSSRKLTLLEFSKICGGTPSPMSLSTYLRGKTKPGLKIAKIIEKATSGKVTTDDLMKMWEAKNGMD